jgi:hypothetical protein
MQQLDRIPSQFTLYPLAVCARGGIRIRFNNKKEKSVLAGKFMLSA